MSSSDANNTEPFDAEPRLLVIDAESRLSFSKKNEPESILDFSQMSLSRADTLT